MSPKKNRVTEEVQQLVLRSFPLGSVQSRAAARSLLKESAREILGDAFPPGWTPKTSAQRAFLESAPSAWDGG